MHSAINKAVNAVTDLNIEYVQGFAEAISLEDIGNEKNANVVWTKYTDVLSSIVEPQGCDLDELEWLWDQKEQVHTQIPSELPIHKEAVRKAIKFLDYWGY